MSDVSDVLLCVFWVLFLAWDVWAYCTAKRPERTSSFVYTLPGGGFAALWKYGPGRPTGGGG